jgi:hypothetical protein
MVIGREVKSKLKTTRYMGLLQIINNNQENFTTPSDDRQQRKSFSGNYI